MVEEALHVQPSFRDFMISDPDQIKRIRGFNNIMGVDIRTDPNNGLIYYPLNGSSWLQFANIEEAIVVVAENLLNEDPKKGREVVQQTVRSVDQVVLSALQHPYAEPYYMGIKQTLRETVENEEGNMMLGALLMERALERHLFFQAVHGMHLPQNLSTMAEEISTRRKRGDMQARWKELREIDRLLNLSKIVQNLTRYKEGPLRTEVIRAQPYFGLARRVVAALTKLSKHYDETGKISISYRDDHLLDANDFLQYYQAEIEDILYQDEVKLAIRMEKFYAP